MIKIKPFVEQKFYCSKCGKLLSNDRTIWQGIHIIEKGFCRCCKKYYYSDFDVGQALFTPFQISLDEKYVYGDERAAYWYGEPLLNSLLHPRENKVDFKVFKYKKFSKVIILNCIDFLYGHTLLKLFNATSILEKYKNYGLVLLIQPNLKWLVPKGVAEVWVANLSYKEAKKFNTDLDIKICNELNRFDEVQIHEAYSHPNKFLITDYTKVDVYNFAKKIPSITYVWREDRYWTSNEIISYLLRKLGFSKIILLTQYLKVILLMHLIRRKKHNVKIYVAGIGKSFVFPSWINDRRVKTFKNQEKALCRLYSKSFVVIGVHGSNMILPSAHAGITIDLMPTSRWGNIGQDIVYQTQNEYQDERVIGLRYRFPSTSLSVFILAAIINQILSDFFVNRKAFISYEQIRKKTK